MKSLPPRDEAEVPSSLDGRETVLAPQVELNAQASTKLSQEDEDRIMRFIEKHRKLLEKLA